jgi:hypothetical protein
MKIGNNAFARLFPSLVDDDEQDGSSGFVDENSYGAPRRPLANAHGPNPTNTPGYERNDRGYYDQGRKEARPFEVPKASYQPPAYSDPDEDKAKETSTMADELGNIALKARSDMGDKNAKSVLDYLSLGKLGNTTSEIEASVRQPKPPAVQTGGTGIPDLPDDADEPPPRSAAMQAVVEQQMEAERMKNPRYAAQKKYEEVLNRKIEDRDKSVWKRIKEVLGNVTYGISQEYQKHPNASPWALLAAGAGAGVGGAINRTYNEQREHDAELGLAKRDYELSNEVEEDTIKQETVRSETKRKAFEAMTDREKLIYDQLDKQKKSILEQLRDVDEIDPNDKDERVQAFVKQAADAGVIVLPKKKGSKFNFSITPDGQLIVGDTTTGAYKKGEGNYAKPRTISKDDIPLSRFGLKDDKEIDTIAKSQVGKDFPTRRLKPEMDKYLRSQQDVESGKFLYLNPDGSVNVEQAIADGVLASDRDFENGPDNYEQKVAAKKAGLSQGQAEKRKQVDRLITALSNHKPASSNAKSLPLDEVLNDYAEILDVKDPKKRAAALEYFYKNYLPSIQIQ